MYKMQNTKELLVHAIRILMDRISEVIWMKLPNGRTQMQVWRRDNIVIYDIQSAEM